MISPGRAGLRWGRRESLGPQHGKGERGPHWVLGSGWGRAGLGEAMRSRPVSGSRVRGLHVPFLGASVVRMLRCVAVKAQGHCFSVVHRFRVAAAPFC